MVSIRTVMERKGEREIERGERGGVAMANSACQWDPSNEC